MRVLLALVCCVALSVLPGALSTGTAQAQSFEACVYISGQSGGFSEMTNTCSQRLAVSFCCPSGSGYACGGGEGMVILEGMETKSFYGCDTGDTRLIPQPY